MKVVIGIVGRFDFIDDNSKVFIMQENLRKTILKSGGIPLLIVPTQCEEYSYEENLPLSNEEKEDINQIINKCDGIVIPGTNKLYDFDRHIYNYAYVNNIPMLGICGGMQLMGISNNHKEYLTKIDSATNHCVKDSKYVHNININQNTKLYEILNQKNINVNSRHKMHLEKIDNYIVSALSDDNIIEAIEHPNKPIIGVQWHPESLFDENSKRLFDYFVNMCKKKLEFEDIKVKVKK